MFNVQGGEIIIILLLALVVLGPEKLPGAMRKAGELYGEVRKMATGFQDEFQKAVREPVDEVTKTATLLRDSADFRKLAEGERKEKPKSAEMATGVPLPSEQEMREQLPDFRNASDQTDHERADQQITDHEITGQDDPDGNASGLDADADAAMGADITPTSSELMINESASFIEPASVDNHDADRETSDRETSNNDTADGDADNQGAGGEESR